MKNWAKLAETESEQPLKADLKSRLDAATRIAREASSLALKHFRSGLDATNKSDGSPVTRADQETETYIREALAAAFPGETVFGEEFGQSGGAQDMWIIDPIDGTRSFIAGLPLFGMLLGWYQSNAPVLGIINMPALSEVYAGAKGLGATLNGAPISASKVQRLDDARLFVNEPDKIAQEIPSLFGRIINAGALRRFGADCYPHALVASGHADAVIDYGLQPYDYLPVEAVVVAAGGVMTDWQGQPLSLTSDGRTVTAATPELHAELLKLVST